MPTIDPKTEARLNARLDTIHQRLQWIADTEARAAWFQTFGANGEFDQQREKLIGDAEAVLDALEAINGTPGYRPK